MAASQGELLFVVDFSLFYYYQKDDLNNILSLPPHPTPAAMIICHTIMLTGTLDRGWLKRRGDAPTTFSMAQTYAKIKIIQQSISGIVESQKNTQQFIDGR